MPLLDRFRRQPHWKQEDPLVRIAGVEELPLDQQDLLITIAREDGDARVRVAAVKKIIDPAVLADIARQDRDDGVREEAIGIVRDVALGVFENSTEAESLASLALLTDARHIMTVAETASLASVRTEALLRLDDPKAIGAVARRAADAASRLAALGRLSDAAEILAVALKSEHKDVGLAAVERLTDAEALRAVAARGTTKAVVRRAKALLEALEPHERAAPGPSAPVAPSVQSRETRQADLCRLAESLAQAPAGPDISARLEKAERLWAELGDAVEEDYRQRFVSACGQVRARLAEAESARAEQERVAGEAAVAVAARKAICDGLASADGETTLAEIERARAAWSTLPPFPSGHDAQALVSTRQFEEAVAACQRRYARWQALGALRTRANETCQAAERIADSLPFPDAHGAWAGIQRTWNEHLGAGLADQELLGRFSQADVRFHAREAEAREAQARQRQANLDRITRFRDRVERLLADPQLTLKDAERTLRELREVVDHLPPLPQKHDHDEMAARLKALQAALSPKVQELREIDEWQRWANAGIQEQLCSRVEALIGSQDAAEAARQLRDIQEEWRRANLVPREKAQALWSRYKAASDAVRAQCAEHFARQAEERAANLARKEALCRQAETLSRSSDWIRTAEAIKALQAEWKNVGPLPHGQERALWERFRQACDQFFTRRHEDLARRKEAWAANLAKKQSLCERIEALAESSDWDSGIEDIKRAQAEWKAIGPVRRTRAEAIWERFRTACDRFHERYRDRDNARLAAARAEREALCAEIEILVGAGGDAESAELPAHVEPAPVAPPGDLAERVLQAWERWRELEKVEDAARSAWVPLRVRFASAVERVIERHPAEFAGTPLDSDQTRRTMVELCERVEAALASVRPAAETATSPAALLAQQLREALAANTIGGRAAAAAQEAKWRDAGDEVAAAEAHWRALGPVPGEAGRALARRFQRACQRFAQQRDHERQRHRSPDRVSGHPRQPGRGQ